MSGEPTKSPWDLELHETAYVDSGQMLKATRVPGGWLYQFSLNAAPVFVPHIEPVVDLRETIRKIDCREGRSAGTTDSDR